MSQDTFYTPWKHQKIFYFLIFSCGRNVGGINGLIDLNLLNFQKEIRLNTNIKTHLLTPLSSDEVQVEVLGLKIFLRLIRVPQNIMWERQRGYHNDFQGDYQVSEFFMRCWWQVSQFILSNILFLFSRCAVNERGCIKRKFNSCHWARHDWRWLCVSGFWNRCCCWFKSTKITI